MDLINALSDANMLAEPGLLLFVNECLDNKYSTMALLLDLLNKYPSSTCIINNIIKKYIEKVPNKVYEIIHGSPVIMICIYDHHIETVKILLNNCINVNYQYDCEGGWTALHCASFYNNINIVKLLVENDATANIKDKDGDNALYLCDDDEDLWDDHEVNKIIQSVTILNAKN